MTVLIVAATAIAGAGAIAALAPLDVRLGLIGLTAALVGAALIADPLPGPAVLAVRLSAALLAVVLLRSAATGVAARPRSGREDRGPRGWSGQLAGSEIGWPASILLGVAGAAGGLAIGLTAFTTGWAAGVVALAGLMAVLAAGPMLATAGGVRRAVAAVLATQAAILARAALTGGTPAAVDTAAGSGRVLDEIVFAALLVAVAGVTAAMILAGGLEAAPVAATLAAADPRSRGTAERPVARRP